MGFVWVLWGRGVFCLGFCLFILFQQPGSPCSSGTLFNVLLSTCLSVAIACFPFVDSRLRVFPETSKQEYLVCT